MFEMKITFKSENERALLVEVLREATSDKRTVAEAGQLSSDLAKPFADDANTLERLADHIEEG